MKVSRTKALFRAGIILVLICTFLVFRAVCTIFDALKRASAAERIKHTQMHVSRFSQWILGVLGWKVSVSHPEAVRAHRGFIVSNHLSFWDVLVMSSVVPMRFVTSIEVRESLGLGTVCRLAGCIFIERRRRLASAEDIRTLNYEISVSPTITFFPEATSSDGHTVLPFRSALFEAALSTQLPVLPLCMRYRNVDLADVTYTGSQTFFQQFWRSCGVGNVHVEVSALPAFPIHDTYDRKRLSQKAFQMILARYHDPDSHNPDSKEGAHHDALYSPTNPIFERANLGRTEMSRSRTGAYTD